jgi:hypothetical protein
MMTRAAPRRVRGCLVLGFVNDRINFSRYRNDWGKEGNRVFPSPRSLRQCAWV